MPQAAYITIKKDPENKSQGKVVIETPFNEAFKEELKDRCKTAAWSGEAWTVDISERRIAENLVKEYYRNCPAYLVEGAVTTNLHTGEVY
jgi:hypothetical protein